MEADFTIPEDWKFKREYSLPQAYKGFVLRGAKVITASGETGTIIVQTYEQPLFTIRFRVVELFRSVKISLTSSSSRLVSFLALKSDHHYKLAGIGVLKLNSGQFSIFHTRQISFEARYEKNITYHSLEINWSDEIVRENSPYFKLLDAAFDSEKVIKSFFLGKPAHVADNKIIDLAGEILKSPYNDTVSGLLFQHKVREFFILMLVAVGKLPATGLHLTAEEWKKIDKIAERLRSQPDKKFPIAGLASEAQMNSTKLKEGFKKKYDSGMFEYQMAWRMKEAMRLLEETNLNVKEIKDRIGYKSLSSFITKFREYHGYPPGKVIRKPR